MIVGHLQGIVRILLGVDVNVGKQVALTALRKGLIRQVMYLIGQGKTI